MINEYKKYKHLAQKNRLHLNYNMFCMHCTHGIHNSLSVLEIGTIIYLFCLIDVNKYPVDLFITRMFTLHPSILIISFIFAFILRFNSVSF